MRSHGHGMQKLPRRWRSNIKLTEYLLMIKFIMKVCDVMYPLYLDVFNPLSRMFKVRRSLLVHSINSLQRPPSQKKRFFSLKAEHWLQRSFENNSYYSVKPNLFL